MKKTLMIFFLILLKLYLFSQNLILNGSFEEGNICPDNFSYLKFVNGWKESNFSTDYYNICAVRTIIYMGIPYNEMGYQQPKTGKSYAGFIPGIEELECKLKSPLIKDSIYYIEYYVSLSDTSSYATWSLGAAFTKDYIDLNSSGKRNVLKITPQIQNSKDNYLDSQKDWMKVSGYFKAIGNEQYLIIGSFSSLDEVITTCKRVIKEKPMQSYYYIDDVSLIKILFNPKNQYLFENKVVSFDSPIVLNAIYFESDKAILLSKSYTELDKLFHFLSGNKSTIEIGGHTDNSGDPEKNKKLSFDRANNVKKYLVKKGILSSRITCKGYGQSVPIGDNNTPESRKVNRRVEFKILKTDE